MVQSLSYVWLCDPMDSSTPGFPVPHRLPEVAQTHVHWVSDAIQPPILHHPLLVLSTFPSIRVFSNESALRIRWPKYWSFSFSISPFNEYLISFRIDRFNSTSLKASILQHSASFMVQLSHSFMTTGTITALTIWTFVGKVMSLLLRLSLLNWGSETTYYGSLQLS